MVVSDGGAWPPAARAREGSADGGGGRDRGGGRRRGERGGGQASWGAKGGDAAHRERVGATAAAETRSRTARGRASSGPTPPSPPPPVGAVHRGPPVHRQAGGASGPRGSRLWEWGGGGWCRRWLLGAPPFLCPPPPPAAPLPLPPPLPTTPAGGGKGVDPTRLREQPRVRAGALPWQRTSCGKSQIGQRTRARGAGRSGRASTHLFPRRARAQTRRGSLPLGVCRCLHRHDSGAAVGSGGNGARRKSLCLFYYIPT